MNLTKLYSGFTHGSVRIISNNNIYIIYILYIYYRFTARVDSRAVQELFSPEDHAVKL